MLTQNLIRKKICLLGSYGVGKTSLVRRFVYNKFEEKYLSTIGVHISKKTVLLKENKTLEFYIWDIANIEKFDSITKSYINGANGALIINDITRPLTINQSKNYADVFLELNPNAKILFVGNKIDLNENSFIDEENYYQNFSDLKTEFYFSSAKTGENVENIFSHLAKKLIEEI